MSRRSISIAIGGVMAADLLPALLTAAAQDGLALDWSATTLTDDEDDLEYLRQSMISNGDRPFHLFDEDAKNGGLDAVEAFCREQGLPYRRMEDPSDEGDGQIAWWEPGMAEATQTLGDADGDAVVKVKELTAAMKSRAPLQAVKAIIAAIDAPEVPNFRLG